MNFSPSKIETFNQCPFKYNKVYNEGFKITYGKEAKFGEFLHKVFENYFSHLINEQKSMDKEFLCRHYDFLYKTMAQALPKDYYDKGQTIVNYQLGHDIDWQSILAVEQFFSLNYPELGVSLTGKMDKIEKAGKKITVIDWKTGQDAFFDPRNLQYIFYSHVVPILYPDCEEFTFQWNYIYTGKIFSLPVYDKQESKSIIHNSIKRILDTKEFLPQDNKFCKNCDLRSKGLCPLKKS